MSREFLKLSLIPSEQDGIMKKKLKEVINSLDITEFQFKNRIHILNQNSSKKEINAAIQNMFSEKPLNMKQIDIILKGLKMEIGFLNKF